MPLESPKGKLDVPFHVLSVSGMTGSGKTTLACLAPKIAAIMSTDHRYEAVIKKMVDWESSFLAETYGVRVDLSVDEAFKDSGNDKAAREAALIAADRQGARIRKESWEPILRDLDMALKHPGVRSIIWDYADELYDILRLSYFGKLERNSQLGYVPVNMEYKQQIASAHRYRKNLVLVQQMAQKYTQEVDELSGVSKSTRVEGEYRKKGSASADYYIHSFVETRYVPPVRKADNSVAREGRYLLKIVQAKLNPALDGALIDVPGDWPTLMQLLAPDEPMEGWL